MPNRERNVGINIRVTPEEKKKIARYAKRCRLTLSEYIRKVAVRDEPKVMIPKDIENSIVRIQSVIADMDEERLSETDPFSKWILGKYRDDLHNITVDTLQLLINAAENPEETTDGDN